MEESQGVDHDFKIETKHITPQKFNIEEYKKLIEISLKLWRSNIHRTPMKKREKKQLIKHIETHSFLPNEAFHQGDPNISRSFIEVVARLVDDQDSLQLATKIISKNIELIDKKIEKKKGELFTSSDSRYIEAINMLIEHGDDEQKKTGQSIFHKNIHTFITILKN